MQRPLTSGLRSAQVDDRSVAIDEVQLTTHGRGILVSVEERLREPPIFAVDAKASSSCADGLYFVDGNLPQIVLSDSETQSAFLTHG